MVFHGGIEVWRGPDSAVAQTAGKEVLKFWDWVTSDQPSPMGVGSDGLITHGGVVQVS